MKRSIVGCRASKWAMTSRAATSDNEVMVDRSLSAALMCGTRLWICIWPRTARRQSPVSIRRMTEVTPELLRYWVRSSATRTRISWRQSSTRLIYKFRTDSLTADHRIFHHQLLSQKQLFGSSKHNLSINNAVHVTCTEKMYNKHTLVKSLLQVPGNYALAMVSTSKFLVLALPLTDLALVSFILWPCWHHCLPHHTFK